MFHKCQYIKKSDDTQGSFFGGEGGGVISNAKTFMGTDNFFMEAQNSD